MAPKTEHEDALGFIVLYGMTDKRDKHVAYDEAIAAIEKHELRDAQLANPTRSRAYSRAVAASETQDRFARRVVNDAEKKVSRFYLAEQERGTERMKFPAEDRVVFDKKAETISVEGEHSDRIKDDFEHFAKFVTGDDIRQMTRMIVEGLDGVSLRGSVDVPDAGGTYFVPIQHRQQLEALANVLDDLRVGYLRSFVVVKGEAEQMQIALQAEFTIQRQLNEIVHLIKQLTSRVSAATAYRKQLDRLAVQLRDYANITGRKASGDVEKNLARAIEIADAKIAELTPKPKPRGSGGRKRQA